MSIFDDITIDKILDKYEEEKREHRITIDSISKLTLLTKKDIINSYSSIPKLIKVPKDNGKYRDIYVYEVVDTCIFSVLNDELYKKYGHLISKNVFSYKQGISILTPITKFLNMKSEYKILLDITDFFNSIDGIKVVDDLKRNIDDEELINFLYKLILNSKYKYKGEILERKKCIPAGNPISAFLTNFSLREMDEIIPNISKGYCRYGDDIAIAIDKEEDIKYIIDKIRNMVGKYGLTLNDNKIQICRNNYIYLGCSIEENEKHISETHIKRRKIMLKEIRTKYKKKYEKSKDKNKLLLYHIREINNKFLGSNIDKSLIKSLIMMSDTTKELSIIDNIIVRNFQIAYTGKNNKHCKERLPSKVLYSLGLIELKLAFTIGKSYIFQQNIKLNDNIKKLNILKYSNEKILIDEKYIFDMISGQKIRTLSDGKIIIDNTLYSNVKLSKGLKSKVLELMKQVDIDIQYWKFNSNIKYIEKQSKFKLPFDLDPNYMINVVNLINNEEEV